MWDGAGSAMHGMEPWVKGWYELSPGDRATRGFNPRHHPLKRVQYSSNNFWGLVQNSGKPIRMAPCDLEK